MDVILRAKECFVKAHATSRFDDPHHFANNSKTVGEESFGARSSSVLRHANKSPWNRYIGVDEGLVLVHFYGVPRATADIDYFSAVPANAQSRRGRGRKPGPGLVARMEL